MLVLSIHFRAGRFHANPWGEHINTGSIEWPPSPWRLLRSLIAVGHRKTDIPKENLQALIEKLSPLPLYYIPCVTTGHTRHYLRQYKAGDTSMVFDTFLVLNPEDRVLVGWPGVTLNDGEASQLDSLLEGLQYLGRAESWVEVTRKEDWGSHRPNCVPIEHAHEGAPPSETIQVAAARKPDEFTDWLATERELRINALEEAKPGKKIPKKERDKALAPLPTNWWEALHCETADIQKQGWNRAPALRWVGYTRPRHIIGSVRRTSSKADTSQNETLTVARYAIQSAVLPPVGKTIFIAERLKEALVRRTDPDKTGNADPLLAGHKNGSTEHREGHDHAFYLPLDEDGDGRIDTLVVWCPGGLQSDQSPVGALDAVRGIQRLWGKDGHDLHLLLTMLGTEADFKALQPPDGLLFQASKTWVSATPFVPTRHWRKGRDVGNDASWINEWYEKQIRLDLSRRGFPDPASVEIIATTRPAIAAVSGRGKPGRWIDFHQRRGRTNHGSASSNKGIGFQIEFDQPVAGPIALGYGCHYGLGLFLPLME